MKFFVHMLARLDGAATPAYTFQTGAGDGSITDTGAGDAALDLNAADGIDSSECIALAQCGEAYAASTLRSAHVVHDSDVIKAVMVGAEGGSGAASAAADVETMLALIGVGTGLNTGKIIAAGSVAYGGGTPAYTWQEGMSGTITDAGTGDADLLMQTADGIDAANAVMICTPRSAYVASRAVALGVVHTSDISKTVTGGKEAATGNASIASDEDFDFVIFAPGKMEHSHHGLEIVAGGVVNVSASPTFDVNGGLASVAQTATGDYAVTLDEGIDASECAIIATPAAAYAASTLVAIHTQHDSDTVKSFMISAEGGSGAASALADHDFGFIIVKKAA